MRKVLLGLLAGIAIATILIALQPSEFRVSREALIDAPADLVIAEIEDFRRWQTWSPWERLDPGMERTYGGSAAGVGATYHWVGNDEVGEGRMEITALEPLHEVVIRLDFLAPVATTNEATFTLEPVGAGTRVTWSMTGRRDWAAKLAGLLFDMEDAIGRDFEAGLASLAGVCEPLAADWKAQMLHGAEDAAAKERAAAEAAALRLGPENP
jgi:hypothetical protein